MSVRQRVISVPEGFTLYGVVYSHGWFDLPPFQWDRERGELQVVLARQGKTAPVRVVLSQTRAGELDAEVQAAGRWTDRLDERFERGIRTVLGLDTDVGPFFRKGGRRYAWAKKIGLGRFLRADTAFEDALKMLSTTNCSWSLTRSMTSRLVASKGEQVAGSSAARSFPTAEQLAEMPVDYFKDEVKAGYRAVAMKELASQVAAGEVAAEAWCRYPGTTAELIKEISSLRGFGRYSAEGLCRLFGRHDGLALDSWCLAKFPKLYGPFPEGTDIAREITTTYEPMGQWRGLALWLDLTRDWHKEHELPAFFQKR